MSDDPKELPELGPQESAAIVSVLDLAHVDFGALQQLNALIPGAAQRLFDAHLAQIIKSAELDERELAIEEKHQEREKANDPREHVMRILGTISVMMVVAGAFWAFIAGRHVADVLALLAAFGVFITAIRSFALKG